MKSIDNEIERYRGSIAIGAARHWQLTRIRDFLEAKGFPIELAEKRDLSLIPFVFQEANYDDIEWSAQYADLGHLSKLFSIDAQVMNNGKERSALTAAEFRDYLKEARQAIDLRKAPGT